MRINVLLFARIAQIIFALVVLGLTSYVTSWWMGFYEENGPPQTNFLLFNSIWTLLIVSGLIAAQLKAPEKITRMLPFITVGVEAIATLFWFAAFVATAVFLSHRACFGDVCYVARAAVAFGAFEFIAFGITACLAGVHAFHYFKSHKGVSSAGPQPPMASMGQAA